MQIKINYFRTKDDNCKNDDDHLELSIQAALTCFFYFALHFVLKLFFSSCVDFFARVNEHSMYIYMCYYAMPLSYRAMWYHIDSNDTIQLIRYSSFENQSHRLLVFTVVVAVLVAFVFV